MTTPTPSGLNTGETEAQSPRTDVLPRRLGALALAILIIAFNAPIAAMAGFQQLAIGFGNGIGAPVAFLVAGAVLFLFSVGFVGMSRYIRHPGAFYCYIVEGMGKATGLGGAFLATAAYVLFAAGSYVYLGLIGADLAERLVGQPFLVWPAWALIFLAIITVLGLLRVDLSMKVLGILVLLEIAVVAIWQAAVLINGGPEGYSTSSFAPSAFLSGNVGVGILFAMLTLIGIEAGACFRDETRNPDRSVKRATYGAIIFLAVFYALGSWVYIITQGSSRVVDQALSDPVGSFFTSIEQYIGAFFVNLVAIILVTSQVAATNSVQGAGSRYLYALGRDGALPRPLARVHSRLQSPYVAVLSVTFISLVVIAVVYASGIDAVPAFAALTGMGIFFLLPLLIATSGAVIVFYRKHPELNPGLWISLIAPALSIIALSALFVIAILNPSNIAGSEIMGVVALVGIVTVAIGGFFLALRYKRTRPAVYERIGTSGQG